MGSKNDYRSLLSDLLSIPIDQNSTEDLALAHQLEFVKKELVERSKKLNDLIQIYSDDHRGKSKQNRRMKWILFGVFIALLVVLTGAVVFVCIKTDFNNVDISSVISLLSVMATYVTSIISIIRIMCKYLFPPDEEKFVIDMIKSITANDAEILKS